ncbi:hypothetical protein [Rivihabitans pingtungensis]|jgi:hypothetical protein|uniref:Uncharacterized protein n=1 Tax=Rivihabitans pingtungensis TaxID=1054498 RepID=A0A318KW58_9NEIS|nr:hypothetical protein [Rivihabitans pingtungensis]PXX81809.1 hypothetical protein DFR34_10138 [Rivihabitans pingtungensis]HNX70815.1 hypothetical protein [Rivihabitans pingtungensis]
MKANRLSRRFSLLAASAGQRLAMALLAIAGLWTAVIWALSEGGL